MPAARILTPDFLTLAAGNFMFWTNLAAYFLLPLHLRTLGASDALVGVVMGLYSGTSILCQPVVGVWVDRVGRRPFMLVGAALAALGALGFAAAPEALSLFLLLRVVQGMGSAMYFVSNFTLIVDLVPAARRGQALGIFGISGLTSTAVGPALGEVIVRAWGFRVFFLATASLAVLALLVSARVAEPPARRAAASDGPAVGPLGAVLVAPRLPMTLGFGFGLGLGVVFTFLPLYAATLGIERIGPFAVAYAAGALLVRALGGRLIDTVGRKPVIVPALGIQAAGAAVLAVTGALVGGAGFAPVPLIVLTGLLLGVAHGFLYPALSALVLDLTPEGRRGQVIAVFSTFVGAGQATGAMSFGTLTHWLGYGPAFAVLTLCLTAACLLATRLDR
ncbi:MAG: MFS transporter [Candidatus Rokuibacteriota bacterium]